MSKALMTALLAAAVLVPVAQAVGQEHTNYINMFIRLEDEAQYGLGKLSSEERARLNDVFGSIVAKSEDHLRNSALAFLENTGWVEVEMAGIETHDVDPEQGPRPYVTATRAGLKYVLEPVSGMATAQVGSYLGTIGQDELSIIDYEGKLVEYFVRKVLR